MWQLVVSPSKEVDISLILLPSNQLCQFIRGDEYTYFTSNENAIHDNADYHHCTTCLIVTATL